MDNEPIIREFDDLLSSHVLGFFSISEKIGENVAVIGKLVVDAFTAERAFICKALTCQSKPDQESLKKMLEPISSIIAKVEDLRNKNRSDKFFNHLSAISESIGALGWVLQEPAPGPFVKQMLEASQFYLNRVLKDFKATNPIHGEWTSSWTQILTLLGAYIKQHHTTGLSWGRFKISGSKSGDLGVKDIPAPPPPPPPFVETESNPKNGPAAHSSLFNEINRGSNITSNLKKVTPDMQTHKNPELRNTTSSEPSKNSGPATMPKPNLGKPAVCPALPPKLELVGNKWTIEYFKNKQDIIVSETENKHTAYIYKCENCCIQIKGKINSIVLDSCKKTGLMFENLISAVDVVNCQSVKIQVTGKVPIVNIDKTDGCQVYLSKESMDAHIISAKSSEMNVLLPKDDGDLMEFPIPEQYKTFFNGKNLTTVCAEDLG